MACAIEPSSADPAGGRGGVSAARSSRAPTCSVRRSARLPRDWPPCHPAVAPAVLGRGGTGGGAIDRGTPHATAAALPVLTAAPSPAPTGRRGDERRARRRRLDHGT